MSEDEITGVHNLPLPMQVVVMSLHDKHKSLARDHVKLDGKVDGMNETLTDLKADAAAVKKTANIIAWLVGLLVAVVSLLGGGHLLLMRH